MNIRGFGVRPVVNKNGGQGYIAKPWGGEMREIRPLDVLNPTARGEYNKKKAVLSRLEVSNKLTTVPSLVDFSSHYQNTINELFPGTANILFFRRDKSYVSVSSAGVSFSADQLKQSADNSLVKAGAETSDVIEHRTIYIPDLSKDHIFLGCKADVVNRQIALEAGLHTLEEGSFADSGLKFDLAPFKAIGLIKAVAMAPVFEKMYDEMPVGAILLFGRENFLKIFYDLVILRDFADILALPLKQKA